MTSWKKMSRGVMRVAIAGFGLLAVAGFAQADVTYPAVKIEFFAGNDGQPPAMYNMQQHSKVSKNLDGTVHLFQGGTKGLNDSWEFEWSMTVNPLAGSSNATAGGGSGAFINLANLAVTNNTNENQIFWVLVTMDLDNPINVPTFSKGDVAVSVQSFIGQGATVKNITSGEFAGDPIFESFIDGNSTHTLMNAPTEVNSTGFGTASASASFGEGLDVVTGPAQDTIGIFLKIEVSPMSIATVIGLYEIMPIPAPAALPLLALGALFGRRRRRD